MAISRAANSKPARTLAFTRVDRALFRIPSSAIAAILFAKLFMHTLLVIDAVPNVKASTEIVASVRQFQVDFGIEGHLCAEKTRGSGSSSVALVPAASKPDF
jgi:hypothetical protein